MNGLSLPRGGGFWEMAKSHQNSAIGAYGQQQPGHKTETEGPGKTAGGLFGAGAGYGLAGLQAGTMIGGASGGPVGAAIGAGVGILGYLLS